jgi:hypothetical protein
MDGRVYGWMGGWMGGKFVSRNCLEQSKNIETNIVLSFLHQDFQGVNTLKHFTYFCIPPKNRHIAKSITLKK